MARNPAGRTRCARLFRVPFLLSDEPVAPDWFTPRSARRAARRLEPLARRVCGSYRRLHSIAPKPLAEAPVEPEYFAEVCRFHGNALRLAGEGVLFRDLARGWFDFPARRSGRSVLLRWRIGSPAPSGWTDRRRLEFVQMIDEGGPWDDPGEAP